MKKTFAESAGIIPPTQEDTSKRARELWQSYGCPEGRDQEIWLEAERQLLGVDPKVEGRGEMSVVAISFDQSVSQNKPTAREPADTSPPAAKSNSRKSKANGVSGRSR